MTRCALTSAGMQMEHSILERRPVLDFAPTNRSTVFVVDDEAMVGEVVSVVLSMEGYKTRLFTSPKDALEAFENAAEKPDLLITDYLMSPFSGLELIARCREIFPAMRSILYSGNAGAETIRGNVKPDAFLSKPFLPKELIQTVGDTLAS